jgi:hypothetical protein
MLNRAFATTVAAGAFLVACGMPMSPAQLAQHEEHPYPGHTKAQVFSAATSALRSLGYEIVTSDAASGRIKTAPKLMTVTAYAGSSTAVASDNSLAWTLEVSSGDDGALLHAEPRGYSAGQLVDASRMNGSFLERSFATLYGEIDDDMPGRDAKPAAKPFASKGVTSKQAKKP